MSNQNTYLASKPRYEILDGLRGVAAMLVVAFHLLETYYHMGPDQPISHGYLAVDFFFVLSGFVIGYAYDDRWHQMSLGNFFKRRLVLGVLSITNTPIPSLAAGVSGPCSFSSPSRACAIHSSWACCWHA